MRAAVLLLAMVACSVNHDLVKTADTQTASVTDTKTDKHEDTKVEAKKSTQAETVTTQKPTETTVVQKPTVIYDYDGPNIKRKIIVGGKITKTRVGEKKVEAKQDTTQDVAKTNKQDAATTTVKGTETTGSTVVKSKWHVQALAWLAEWWLWLVAGALIIGIFVAWRYKLWQFIPYVGPLLPK